MECTKPNLIVIKDPDICKRVIIEQKRRGHAARTQTLKTLLIERLTQIENEVKQAS